jgi:transcriptional antiterminator NusG
MAESGKKWYVLRAVSGKEAKVKEYIEAEMKHNALLTQYVSQVLIPTEKHATLRNGKRVVKEKISLPGYVLVEMIMDEDSWYVVRHTSGVTKFVGSEKRPIPARESEIKKIINRSTSTTQKIELDVKAGDKVRIISGPFADFIADIIEVYPDKSKLRANVSIFGRETPVELEYKQIQKL